MIIIKYPIQSPTKHKGKEATSREARSIRNATHVCSIALSSPSLFPNLGSPTSVHNIVSDLVIPLMRLCLGYVQFHFSFSSPFLSHHYQLLICVALYACPHCLAPPSFSQLYKSRPDYLEDIQVTSSTQPLSLSRHKSQNLKEKLHKMESFNHEP
ncbi:hypothetical protein DID88_008091 [Monilinia fructigena]|uniref:Uncharacterized protein n=1 Tax=Monilinia fructigena TaxID=38457 RepID=A0A395J4Q4_9HELO|nr:hypothetical protein DID88_008091 [Monilinia fructigena]